MPSAKSHFFERLRDEIKPIQLCLPCEKRISNYHIVAIRAQCLATTFTWPTTTGPSFLLDEPQPLACQCAPILNAYESRKSTGPHLSSFCPEVERLVEEGGMREVAPHLDRHKGNFQKGNAQEFHSYEHGYSVGKVAGPK